MVFGPLDVLYIIGSYLKYFWYSSFRIDPSLSEKFKLPLFCCNTPIRNRIIVTSRCNMTVHELEIMLLSNRGASIGFTMSPYLYARLYTVGYIYLLFLCLCLFSLFSFF